VPTTIAGLSRLLFLSFLQWPLTVQMKQTRQVICAFKQSILLRCLCAKLPQQQIAVFTSNLSELYFIEKQQIFNKKTAAFNVDKCCHNNALFPHDFPSIVGPLSTLEPFYRSLSLILSDQND
jgi:hypothetical protein